MPLPPISERPLVSPRIPPPPLPPPTPPSGSDELQKVWSESMVNGIKHSDAMFGNILKKFTVPFWLSVAMNVALFVFGMIAFTAGLIYSLLNGKSDFGLVFGGLDVTTFVTFFFNKPIARLERDVGFITWLGLVYNSYWIGLTYATDLSKFQSDLEKITKNATSSIGDLLDKAQKLESSSTTDGSGKTSQEKPSSNPRTPSGRKVSSRK